MSIDVRAEVSVSRPRSEIAYFMFDPKNDAIWTGGVVEAHPLQEGVLRPGARVERISKFMGRRFGYVIDVVDGEPERWLEMRATKPFEMRVRYDLTDEASGTRVAIHTRGDAGGFFKLASPLLATMVRRAIQNDLEMLKAYLEAEPR